MLPETSRSDAALRMASLFKEKEAAAAERYQDQAKIRKEKAAFREVMKSADSEMLSVLAEVDDVGEALYEATGVRLTVSSVTGSVPMSKLFSGPILKTLKSELQDQEDAYPNNLVGILFRVEGKKGMVILAKYGDLEPPSLGEAGWAFMDTKAGIVVMPLSLWLPEPEESE